MSGPLPKPGRRRRNAPLIPTTRLPAGGRAGTAPRPPKELGPAGKKWWTWAWRTPQAAAWSAGDMFVIARRARLEDLVTSLESFDEEALPLDPELLIQVIHWLKSLAVGALSVHREMRELDDRLGLTPRGRQSLRWVIAPDEVAEARTAAAAVSTRARLRAVDPLVAGT